MFKNNKIAFKSILTGKHLLLVRRTLGRRWCSSSSTAHTNAARSVNLKNVYTTVLPNKLVVVTQDNVSPLSRVALAFRAGSRYETPENLGVTHMLRLATGSSTSCSTGLGITRAIQQIGGSITCATDREIIAYECEVMKSKLDIGLHYLKDISLNQIFHADEMNHSSIAERLDFDLCNVTDQFMAYDLLHRAAYETNGLGNSLFCRRCDINSHNLTGEHLHEYVRKYFIPNRTAIIGISVDHDYLVEYAKNLELDDIINETTTDSTPTAAVFQGGNEQRLHRDNCDLASISIGTEAAGMNNLGEAFIFDILREILGAGPVIQYGNSTSVLGRSMAKALPNKCYGCNSFGSYYIDSGVFGVNLTTTSKDIGNGIQAAMHALRSMEQLSDEDIARGKAQLIGTCYYLYEYNQGCAKDLIFQASYMGFGMPIEAVITQIQNIPSEEIIKVSKKVASGNWSIGAVGNLENVPNVNQL